MSALETEIAEAPPGRRAVLLERFWHTHGRTTPMVEGTRDEPIVTFMRRSADASRTLIFVNRITDETDLASAELLRIAGTDLWHRSYRVPPGWRASYGFIDHADPASPPPWSSAAPDHVRLRALLDAAVTDPRNPLTAPNRAGHLLSVAELPDAPAVAWPLIPPAAAASRARERVGPGGRRCWIVDPSPRSDTPRTLWFILDGEVWERFGLSEALSRMHEQGAARLCAVLIDSISTPRRWQELGDPAKFAIELVEEWLPWAESQLGETFPPERCGIAGQSIGGFTALFCGIERPDVFGRVIAQSPSLWLELGEIPMRDRSQQWIFTEVGSEEWVLRDPHRKWVDRLEAHRAGGLRIESAEFAGGHDYACWRVSLPAAIAALSRPARGANTISGVES